ncbi:ATP-binding protein, partial [Roseateles sp. GG27B]
MEVANKELEAFAYSVSHDLRAPLRAIDGFSRKVVTGYGDRLDDEGRRQLQVVRDNAQRMGQLIDDLLAFSRMGRREMAHQPLDMDAMARSVVGELQNSEPARSITFNVLPIPATTGDAAMLRQVWLNLIGNAIKFTRYCKQAHIEIGGTNEGDETVYWVKDDGAGFAMQYADKLFGVFQRLHRQDEFEGTGVGLAIAQRILLNQAMGLPSILLCQTHEQATMFSEREESVMNATNQELEILLVEDSTADAELTMDALRSSGLINHVQWAKDGAEALDLLFGRGANSAAENGRLRLILLDLRLPR